MNASDRYQHNLCTFPAPGNGAHGFLLSTANFGILSGIDPVRMFSDIREAIPHGIRRIPDREIREAIQKALQDNTSGGFKPMPKPAPLVKDGKAALKRIMDGATINEEVDVLESSPIRLWNEPSEDPVLLFAHLFNPGDFLFIGDRTDTATSETLKPVCEWIDHFRKNGSIPPLIIPNPLSGLPAPKRDGTGLTYRGDACVKDYRYCVCEFDNIPKTDQLKFWSGIKLPIACLIDSGGKSIHAWIDVQKIAKVRNDGDWQREIKSKLYDDILTPMGVDRACSNPARLSRMPGHYRTEKGALQKLLWLRSKDGDNVSKPD